MILVIVWITGSVLAVIIGIVGVFLGKVRIKDSDHMFVFIFSIPFWHIAIIISVVLFTIEKIVYYTYKALSAISDMGEEFRARRNDTKELEAASYREVPK